MLEIILGLFAFWIRIFQWNGFVCIFSAVIRKPYRIKSEMRLGISSTVFGLSVCIFDANVSECHSLRKHSRKSTVVWNDKTEYPETDRKRLNSVQLESGWSQKREWNKKIDRIIWHLGNTETSRCKPRSQDCRYTHHQCRVTTVVNILL